MPGMKSQRFNVTAVPLKLVDQGDKIRNEEVTVRNVHATQAVDIGGSDVVTAAGYELKAGEQHDFTLGEGDELWAVSAAGQTTPVEVIFTYVGDE